LTPDPRPAPGDGVLQAGERLRLPFRLGTTSYIIPDDILPNLDHLAGRVDDVELVLFESDEFSNMPTPDDVDTMARVGREANLSFTVHLPLDTRLGSDDEGDRVASVGKCRRVMERMAPLAPFAWILHLHGDRRGTTPTDDMPRWLRQNARSLEELLSDGVASRRVCVETLDYDFGLLTDLVERFDTSVCLDLGHLLVYGRDIPAHLERWGDRARVYHLHGVRPDGTDHAHLAQFPPDMLRRLATMLAERADRDATVVTLEVFGEDDFERSIETVREVLVPWHM